MRLFLRNNSLTLVFTVLVLGALLGQSVAGWKVFNEEQLAHDSPTISYARYLVTSHFGEAVIENWQSEYLQFTCFILATVWLVQRGSNESKKPEDAGLESDAKQLIGAHAQQNSPAWAKLGDWRAAIYSNSLLIVMGLLFLGSWFAQSVTAWTEYNSEQREHDESGVSWAGYLARADFWEKTLQNWQSEFLAVATMAIFTVYLRQRGSPESKPVGAPHDQTASSG
jgi:membrane protein implicated in regulation of membrane protease activity